MRTAFANIVSGSLIALVNISVVLSSAALMFAQTDSRLLVAGIAIMMVGTVVVGLGGTLFSGYQAVICSPRAAVIPIFAVMVSSIFASYDGQYSLELEATVIAAVMLTSLITGMFLLLLGHLRLGKLVRYIPYPVTGGFFAGIGFLFIQGGLEVVSGSDARLSWFIDPEFLQLAAPAVVLALCLILGQLFRDNRLSVPVILLAGIAIFYGLLQIRGISVDDAAARGLLPVIDSTSNLLPVYELGYFSLINWMAIYDQIGGILVIALLSAMVLLLDVSGIEVMSRRDLDPDHELKVMGYTNIVNSAVAGMPGVHDAADTALVARLGADGRLTGFIYVGLVVLAILAGTDSIELVPNFVLGGLLIYLGLEFLINWLWKARGELPLSDYVVVILILIVIVFSNILQGVTFGLFVAIILFVINYSQLSVIKSEVKGSDHGSNIDRDLETRELLNREGDRILILSLQGFIFFGTADKLISTIRYHVQHHEEKPIEYLVLDFYHVSQLDTSAIVSFAKLSQLSERFGFNIVISAADEKSIKQLVRYKFFTFGDNKWQRIYRDHLDYASAWCEAKLLASLNVQAEDHPKNLDQILEQATGSVDDSRLLQKYFVEEKFAEGSYLIRQGASGSSLYFVGSGVVVVVLDISNKQERILRIYKSGAMLGEMALYTSETRSASVRVDADALLYRLDKEKFIQMQIDNPVAAAGFHAYIVKVLAERLRRANRELSRYL